MLSIQFDESYYPVPAGAQDADPTADMRDLLFRLSKADGSLQECEQQRQADLQEILGELIEVSDRVLDAVEAADVPSSAKETALINGLIGFGRGVRELLERQHVEALVTIGMPWQADVAEVVGYEPYAQVPPGTVLRERRVGYRWPGGILRQAQVVVAGAPLRATEGEASAGPAPRS